MCAVIPMAVKRLTSGVRCWPHIGLLGTRPTLQIDHRTQQRMNMSNHPSAASGLFLFSSVLLLAGCASAPLSFVEGMPQTQADPSLYPVRVVSIDGSLQFSKSSTPIQLSPGPRWMVLEAAPSQSARRVVQKAFVFKVEPCTRYVFAARRASPMDSDWSLVVDRTEPVSRCNVEEELQKAAQATGAAGAASSAGSGR